MNERAASGRGLSGRTLVLLGALTAIAPMSVDLYLPALPAIARGLGAAGGSAELTLASFFVGVACGQLVYGPLSDRFGRVPPLYFGLGLYAVASAGCMLASSLPALVAWRFCQALGGCAGMVIARAVVRDRCTALEAARAFSTLILVMGLAPILGPLFGGWLLMVMGWRALFGVLTVFGLGCLFAAFMALAETHRSPQPDALRLGVVARSYAALMVDRSFIAHALSGGLAMAGMFAYIVGSPFVLIELHGIAPQNFGWVFGSNAAGLIFGAQVNARLTRHHALGSLLRAALWVPALAGIGLLLVTMSGWSSLPLLVIALFCYVASLGFVLPNSSALALASHGRMAGTASALLGALQFALATVVGGAMSAWHDGTAMPMAFLMALSGASAWLWHRALVRSS